MLLKALRGKVLVNEIKKGERNINGIIIPDDDKKDTGIRPRWCKVYAVGEEVDTIEPGDWLLVEHGRWSREMRIKNDQGNEDSFWSVDWPTSVLGYSREDPEDLILK